MDLLDLRLFELIAERGSVSAAATALHLSQPSASARISKLETSLRVRLIERSTNGSVLTEAGASYQPYARRARVLLEEGARLANQATPQLRVGLPASYSAAFAPELIAALGQDHHLTITSAHASELRTMLLDGSLDIALTDHPGLPHGLVTTRAGTARPVALAQPGTTIADITRWAVHAWGSVYEDVLQALVTNDVPPSAITDVSPASAAIALARSSNHAAITLDICAAQELRDNTLAPLPIALTDTTVDLRWLHRPDLPRPTRTDLEQVGPRVRHS